MSIDDHSDPYILENGVLKNLLGIEDAAQLRSIEADLTAQRIIQLDFTPIAGTFDLSHLKAIHRFIFQDIFAWAGELRTIDIVKEHSRFAHFRFLESSAQTIFRRLNQEHYLRQTPITNFAQRLAYYLGEINALHPFREGNGRTQRVFLGQLALEAGYELRWELVERDNMIAASISSLMKGDNSNFEEILLNIITPVKE